MNLSKLPKTASYRYKTKATLVTICERFGVNPASLPKHKKDMGEKEQYDFYMPIITGHAACPICNGPQKKDPVRAKNKIFFPEGLCCMDHPNHTVAYNMALRSMRRMAIVIPDGEELSNDPGVNAIGVDTILRALGPVCPHNEYLMDCVNCKERLLSKGELIDIQLEKEAVPA